jgi:hypothetical protein
LGSALLASLDLSNHLILIFATQLNKVSYRLFEFYELKPIIMKNLFYSLLFSSLIVSCGDNASDDATASANADNTKATYEKNVASFEKLCKAWGDQDLEGALNLMADDFMENGTGLGEPNRTKEEWKANNEMMMGIMKPTLKQAMFLPGVDTTTLAMDGSVRYYGVWNFASGEKNLDCKVYGSADFNDEGLMTSLTHYADFGATMMQILPEEVVAQMMGGK